MLGVLSGTHARGPCLTAFVARQGGQTVHARVLGVHASASVRLGGRTSSVAPTAAPRPVELVTCWGPSGTESALRLAPLGLLQHPVSHAHHAADWEGR